MSITHAYVYDGPAKGAVVPSHHPKVRIDPRQYVVALPKKASTIAEQPRYALTPFCELYQLVELASDVRFAVYVLTSNVDRFVASRKEIDDALHMCRAFVGCTEAIR